MGSEYAFAMKNQFAQMRNAAGNFITPNTESISAAAKGDMPADTRTMITNSAAPDAYPISCFTWIILYKEQAYADRNQAQAEETLKLLNWMLDAEAQALTTKVNYSRSRKGCKECKSVTKISHLQRATRVEIIKYTHYSKTTNSKLHYKSAENSNFLHFYSAIYVYLQKIHTNHG